jgi:DNA-binding NtrC family response regulator
MAEEQSPRILLVDDEEMILSSLKSFFVIESDYALLTYTSPQQALKDIDEGRITSLDLVISDYLMAEMDGMTFLTKVKEHFPHTPRILLTGYADKETAIKAINNVGLYQYIEKPWNNDDLRLIIQNGLEKTRLLTKSFSILPEAPILIRDGLNAPIGFPVDLAFHRQNASPPQFCAV